VRHSNVAKKEKHRGAILDLRLQLRHWLWCMKIWLVPGGPTVWRTGAHFL